MKKMLSVLTAFLLAGTCMSLPISASYFDYNSAYFNNPYTVETEQFKYSTGARSITLETDLVDANLMITGVFYRNETDTEPTFYSVVGVNLGANLGVNSIYARGNLPASNIAPYLNGQTLAVGDLLNVQGLVPVEIVPLQYFFDDYFGECSAQYLGNGMDIFGDEFKKVIRHELITKGSFESRDFTCDTSGMDIIYGDLSEDEKVDILDVITLNKNLFGKATLTDYAKLAADVTHDGAVDATDALAIMKYLVGLNETLD